MQQMWDLVSSETRIGFLIEFTRVVARASKAYEAAMKETEWEKSYGTLMGVYGMYFHWNDLLSMYREADRVDQVFCEEQLPMLYLARHRRCLPLYSSLRDPTIERDIESNQKLQEATLPSEAELVVAQLPSSTIQ
jgi:hypothetical protein